MAILPTTAPGRFAAAAAFLLPIAFNPQGAARYWAPKAAIFVVAAAVGLPLLLQLTRTRARPAALAGSAFLAVAMLSTVTSSHRVAALLGNYNWGTGLVFLVACVGVWALGCSVPEEDVPRVAAALLAGIAISSSVAVLQAFDLVRASSLDSGDRAFGLSGNAGRLAMNAAAVVAMGAHGARSRRSWIAAAGAGALVVQLTGTRSALAFVGLLAIVGAVRCTRRRGIALVVVTLSGILVGSWMADVGGRTTATARSSETGTSIVTGGPEVNVRLEVWTSARHAIARRPIVGSGPGQFGGATSRDRTLRVARIEGSEVIYTDAHNIVVEHLVTTGVLGAAVLVVWLLLAFRQAQGTLAWFAGGALVMNLLQPMDAGTTSLLFLTLGVAAPITFAPALRRSIAPVGVALVAAGVLLVGDLQLGRAIEHRDLDRARAANALLRPWPQPASVLGDIHTRQWLEGRESVDSALEWRRVALSRDPTNPGLAIGLAEVEWRSGRLREAEQHFQQAVEHNPWSVVALSRLAKLAHARGDDELAERYARRALEVEPNDDMTRMLERIEQRAS